MLSTLRFEAYSNTNDVFVRIPQELGGQNYFERHPEDDGQNRFRLQTAARARYSEFEYIACSLGQLTKLCDWTGIVEILSVEEMKDDPDRIALSLKIEKTFFGRINESNIEVYPAWRKHPVPTSDRIISEGGYVPEWHNRFKKGDRLLVFFAVDDQENSTPIRKIKGKWEILTLHFDFEKPPAGRDKSTPLKMLYGVGGARMLENEAVENALVEAVNGYLATLRKEQKNPDDYYSLLRRLVLSPVLRIKEDAKSDLVNFLNSCPSFDLNRIFVDKNIDDTLKDYIRHILIPDRERQETKQEKEE
jgi:hypothetical protein